MTPGRFRECLALVAWSGQGLSRRLSCDERLVRRWAAGAAPIPPGIAEWLETLAGHHERHPPPQDWRVRRAASGDPDGRRARPG